MNVILADKHKNQSHMIIPCYSWSLSIYSAGTSSSKEVFTSIGFSPYRVIFRSTVLFTIRRFIPNAKKATLAEALGWGLVDAFPGPLAGEFLPGEISASFSLSSFLFLVGEHINFIMK